MDACVFCSLYDLEHPVCILVMFLIWDLDLEGLGRVTETLIP